MNQSLSDIARHWSLRVWTYLDQSSSDGCLNAYIPILIIILSCSTFYTIKLSKIFDKNTKSSVMDTPNEKIENAHVKKSTVDSQFLRESFTGMII
jgi:hypothetical protein